MAPKKFRALEMQCLQMDDRMMLEEEIYMLKAIIEEKEDCQCHCSGDLVEVSEEGDRTQNLKGLSCALMNEVEALKLKLDKSNKENIALKENNSENSFKLMTLKVKSEKQSKEIDLVKKEVRLEKEENKKLRLLSKKKFEEIVRLNKEIKIFSRVEEKRKQEIITLKAKGIKDVKKFEENHEKMVKSFEEARKEQNSIKSKLEEVKESTSKLASKYNLLNEKLSDKLECPVCLEVPRAGPLPVCPNGHFVCKECKKTTCPTCRAGMGNGKSLLASLVLENIDHRCRFDDCEEYFALDKLDDHEKGCQHRTVNCPFGNCREEVPILKMMQHLTSSKKCCTFSAACITTKDSLVVKRGFTLKQEDIAGKKLCWPTSLYALDGYGVCIFPEKDGGNFYFLCIMFASEEVCSKYKIEMTVHASKSPLDSDLSFKSVGQPTSIDENHNETKYLGLVVNAKAMLNGDKFNISLSMKRV